MPNNCGEYVDRIYKNPVVNQLINKMNPEHLRGELRQEMALALLNYDCDKLIQLSDDGKLEAFAKKVIWNMATLPRSTFVRTFRKREDQKLIDYLSSFSGRPIPDSMAIKASEYLQKKMKGDVNEQHESRVFQVYIQLNSAYKVAAELGIPRVHANAVINKVKNELKQIVKQCL